jgi:hypothetical protein
MPQTIHDLVDEQILDEMCYLNEPYEYIEKKDKEYCIGYADFVENEPGDKDYVLINSLEAGLFYQYSLEYVKLYLLNCGAIPPLRIVEKISPQIIQVVRYPGNDMFYAVNKTRWLIEFQRRFRKYLAKTAPHIEKRRALFIQRQ